MANVASKIGGETPGRSEACYLRLVPFVKGIGFPLHADEALVQVIGDVDVVMVHTEQEHIIASVGAESMGKAGCPSYPGQSRQSQRVERESLPTG